MGDAAHGVGISEPSARLVGEHRIHAPGIPEMLRQTHELFGAQVPVFVGQEPAAAEVAAVEGIR